MGWLYGRTINTLTKDRDTRELPRLADAYVLCERLQSGTFENAVLDAIIASTQTKDESSRKWFPIGAVVDTIYRGTPDTSLARKLMVDMHVYNGASDWITNTEGNDVDFLIDLAAELLLTRPLPSSREPYLTATSVCKHHEHAADRKCYEDA